MKIRSEVLRGSKGNRAPKEDAEDDSIVFGASSDTDLLDTITEGCLAAARTAAESSMDSLNSGSLPVDDSRSVLLCKTRGWVFSGV